ncbi:MAG: MFS transporter [Clostridiales bacterium]|nr:MFS transporter [Clostridiales bacterium]
MTDDNFSTTVSGADASQNAEAPPESTNSGIIKNVIPKKELWVFSIAALGQGMIYAVMSSYISDFYINVLQTPLVFVLLLMLLARIWDAVNDPIMGMFVDKHTTRWGKMKPYVLFAAVPAGVLTFLMFFDPGLDAAGTMVYAAVIYVMWGMVYTVADVPFWSLPNVMTPNPRERGNLISVSRAVNGIGSAVPVAIFMVLGFVLPAVRPDLVSVEMDKLKYMLIAVICAGVGLVLYVLSFFTTKERVSSPKQISARKPGEPGRLMRIFKCKPLMIVIIMGVLASGRYLMNAAAVHVARYAFYIGKDISTLTTEAERTAALTGSISTVSTIFMVCAAVGTFGSMLFMPFLYKKFNYKQIIIVTGAAGFLASLLTTGMGLLNILLDQSWAVYACIPFIIIQCIPLGALNVTSYAMIGDSLDYMEWKTGFRDTALGSACQGFINKLGNALATGFIVLMYMFIALDPAQIYSSGAVKFATDLADGQRIAMFTLVSLIPGISLLLCVIPVKWYNVVGKLKEQITSELAERRSAKALTEE